MRTRATCLAHEALTRVYTADLKVLLTTPHNMILLTDEASRAEGIG